MITKDSSSISDKREVPMARPDDHFPLALSDFEYYVYRDETAEKPMVMVLRWHIEGTIDVAAFRTSLEETIYHHPLLRSVIDQSAGQLRWKLLDDHQPQLICTRHDGEYPPMDCPAMQLDLTREAGGRFELRICPRRSVLVAYLHHACADGIGGIRFLADVFARYGRETASSDAERPEPPITEPTALLKRGAIPIDDGPKQDRFERLQRAARFLFHKNYSINARAQQRPPGETGRSILQTAVLPRPVVVQLRRLAASRQVSVNDLCMMVYLQQLSHWTRNHKSARDSDLFRILMPISMRTPEHDHISAANVLSYVFQSFRRRDCGNPETLLADVHRQSTQMIHGHGGGVLLRMFSLVRRVPGLFWLSQTLQPSFATAVLANVGELRRVFGNRFPLKKGRVVAGNVVIQRIDGIAPLRKHTNVAISFGGYAGELILNLRTDPDVMSAVETERFLNDVISRLTTLAESQSLKHLGESRENCRQTPDSLTQPAPRLLSPASHP